MFSSKPDNMLHPPPHHLREPLHALCVLKGGYKFFSDMLDKVEADGNIVVTSLLSDKQPQLQPFRGLRPGRLRHRWLQS